MSEPTKAKIGSYRVTRRLSGPGEDYEATSPTGARVLVRLFPQAEPLEQLRREVSICATLDHPAMARALEVFEAEDKLALVFRYFDGVPLSQIISRRQARRNLSEPAMWLIGHQLAGVLAQAHSASDSTGDLVAVCHGHLSSMQLVVSGSGELRIEGLGLSAVVGTAELPAPAGYQAPEQAKGGSPTPRSDLYSAAVLVWAGLMGREPTTEQAGPSLPQIADRLPDPLVEPLERALQPAVAKRRITSMELEQAFGEVVDEVAGRKALTAAVRSMLKTSRTLLGTGPMLGSLGMGRATPAQDQSPPERTPEPTPPQEPSPATAAQSAVEKAKEIGARARGAGVRSRQRTLLGAFGKVGAEPSASPRQAVARKPEEQQPAAAAPPALASSPGPALPDLDWGSPEPVEPEPVESPSPPSGAAPPRPTSSRDPMPPPASDRPPPVPSEPPEDYGEEEPTVVRPSVPGLSEEELAAAYEPATLERDLEVPGEEVKEQAIEEMILGATVSAAPPGRPPVITSDIEQLIAEPLATGRSGAPPAAPRGFGVPAAGSPWTAAADPGLVDGSGDKPLSRGKMVLIACATAAVVAVVGLWLVRQDIFLAKQPEPPADSSAAPEKTVSAKPSSTPAPPPTSTVSASSPTASASAPPEEGSKLSPTQGQLQIHFSGPSDAEVFVFGKSYGRVGQKLTVPCGNAFVRVGKLPHGPPWLSAGKSASIKCQALTELTIQPE